MSKHGRVHSFTKRGNVFGNLWKVYSAKSHKDFSLSSDRELAHWILYLEFNPDVISFDLNPSPRSQGATPGAKSTILDAEVVYKGGEIEWHEIKEGSFDKKLISTPQIDLQRELAKSAGVTYVIFNDDDFASRSYEIMPLLRVAACLSAGRNSFILPAIQLEVADYFATRVSGTVGEYIDFFKLYSPDVLLYLLCKSFSLGKINVVYKETFFSKRTRWSRK